MQPLDFSTAVDYSVYLQLRNEQIFVLSAGVVAIALGCLSSYKGMALLQNPKIEVQKTESQDEPLTQMEQAKQKTRKNTYIAAGTVLLGLGLIGGGGWLCKSSIARFQSLAKEYEGIIEGFALKPFGYDARELEVRKHFGKAGLELDPLDPRPKALFLVAEHDYVPLVDKNKINFLPVRPTDKDSYATQVTRYEDYYGEMGSKGHLEQLAKNHDIQYKVISSGNEIGQAIDEAAKTGLVKTLVIFAHGEHNSFQLSSYEKVKVDQSGKLHGLSENSFVGLAPDALISLESCLTGGTTDGIASAIAKTAKRTVFAPTRLLSPNYGLAFSTQAPSQPIMWESNFSSRRFGVFNHNAADSSSLTFFQKIILQSNDITSKFSSDGKMDTLFPEITEFFSKVAFWLHGKGY